MEEIDLLRKQMLAVSESEPFKNFEVLQSALKKGDKDDIQSYQDQVNQHVERILA